MQQQHVAQYYSNLSSSSPQTNITDQLIDILTSSQETDRSSSFMFVTNVSIQLIVKQFLSVLVNVLRVTQHGSLQMLNCATTIITRTQQDIS